MSGWVRQSFILTFGDVIQYLLLLALLRLLGVVGFCLLSKVYELRDVYVALEPALSLLEFPSSWFVYESTKMS